MGKEISIALHHDHSTTTPSTMKSTRKFSRSMKDIAHIPSNQVLLRF